MTLGDLGADVVKVESPAGDDTRSWLPPVDAQGRAAYHHAANRNKRSIVLDLKRRPRPRARAAACASAPTWSSRTSSRARSSGSGSTTSAIAARESRSHPLRDQRLRRARRPRAARLRPARAGGRWPDEHHRAAGTRLEDGRRDRRRRHRPLRDRRRARGAPRARAQRARAARDDRPAAREPRDAREPVDRVARERRGAAAPRQRPPEHRAVRDLPGARRRSDDRRRQRRAVRRSSTGSASRSSATMPTSTRVANAPLAAARGAAGGTDARAHGATHCSRRACPRGRCKDIGEAFSLAATLGLDVIDETDGVRTVVPRAALELAGHGPAPAARPRRARRRDQTR